MPFVRVSFSDQSRAVSMDRQLDETICRLDRPIDLTRRFLGVSPAKGWKENAQLLWCILLSVGLLISWLMSLVIGSISLISMLTMGLFSHCLLLFWGRPSRLFLKSLTASSNGVGVLRSMPKVLRITNVTYSSLTILCSFVSVLLLLSILRLLSIFSIPPVHTSFQIPLAFGVLLSAVVIPPANTIFFSFLFRLIVEFEALDYDFRRDVNASQLSVCRHYFYAHRSLLKMFYSIGRPLG